MLFYLLTGLALGLPAAAQPGPFQAYLLSRTLQNGWRRTLPAALAPLLSDGPIIVLVVVLLTQVPDWFRRGIQVVGGLFLLYLAWRAYQTWRKFEWNEQRASVEVTQQSLVEAALMNFLNPNPYIFWVTVAGPLLLEAWQRSPAHAVSFLVGFYGTLVGGFAFFIILFAGARQLGPRVSRTLTAVSALALFFFALTQLWRGLA